MTMTALNSQRINYCGIDEAAGTDSVQMLSVNGISIAVLAYTYGLSNKSIAGGDIFRIPVFSLERAIRDITLARTKGANLILVLPHWGKKNSIEISDTMRETARQLAEAGADVIAGAHSNVASDVEILETERADGRKHHTLVCYSLGAFLMDARSEENASGMILEAEIEYDPRVRQTCVVSYDAVPLYIYQGINEGERVWRVIDVLDDECVAALTADNRTGALRAKERIEEL